MMISWKARLFGTQQCRAHDPTQRRLRKQIVPHEVLGHDRSL
jgi:hypothetical protein